MRKLGLSILIAGFCLAAFAASSSAKTVWLCKPGQRPDPCSAGLSTTVYTPALQARRVEHPKRVRHPSIDCFYVYPAAADLSIPSSGGPGAYTPVKTGNGNPDIDRQQRSTALYQAARFSQYCRVYAPIYRVTPSATASPGGSANANPLLPYSDVRAALATYLKRYNHRRGFVLIGSGEGATVLRALIHQYIDPHPLVRRLLVSAILEGADVLVKRGSGIGGDFHHIPACRSATQVGCVIAFTIFDQPVPPVSRFGRVTPDQAHHHETVLCTNPAGLGGRSGRLKPIFPSQSQDPGSVISRLIADFGLGLPSPGTAWIAAPGAYRARCSTANHASVLEITPLDGAATPKPTPDPGWGLHFMAVNLALGNLISIVRREAAAYVRRYG